ncbi:hypothetical protein BC628DRAFT_1407410 [Trametes gibbosa]|uniref:AN1-type domain-containing protein n=1 Tax=Trametes gibbosa TaxID=160864 RepID=A0A6G6FQE9_9APHY|nr:hypothetical protein BC628DRAFT_1407410 [Trametes gibbosa]QIE48464.1 hypothetical protein [Trametes gibbosa]
MTNAGSEIVHIGAHCALSSCNLNDFLPIRCKCDRLYCRDHIQPDAHACPVLVQHPQPDAGPSFPKLQQCADKSCTKPSLEAYIADAEDTTDRSPALCRGCGQAFCAEHREPKTHSCSPPEPATPAPQKNAAAKALLAKHFGSSSSATSGMAARPSLPTSNPKKIEQQRKLAIMKMRHMAKPVDPKDTTTAVPIDERLHVKVRRAGADSALEQVLWFRKSVWTGRAVDMLASQFKMTISDSQPLKLLYINDEGISVVLRTDLALADQIHDGASICLSR